MLVLFASLGGCGSESENDAAEGLQEASLPGTYTGAFPCEGCDAIPTTLWLRADGRFFWRQHYPANDDAEAMNAYGLGLWEWSGDERLVVLRGSGPTRKFERDGRDELLMRTDSDLQHRLSRNTAAGGFTDSLRMSGMVQFHGDVLSFTECLTGLKAAVARSGEYGRLLHQYRSVSARGKPVYAEFDGRFSWHADESAKSVAIERFVTVRKNVACSQ